DFFFSSRRRHTRFSRDWSSDVCSSDLAPDYLDSVIEDDEEGGEFGADGGGDSYAGSGDELYDKAVHIVLTDKKASTSYVQRRLRSEARRVGREGSSPRNELNLDE